MNIIKIKLFFKSIIFQTIKPRYIFSWIVALSNNTVQLQETDLLAVVLNLYYPNLSSH